MNTPAAFRATFSDFRLVRSRKQAQFVFEVPIELADAALSALGGLPSSTDERWVAVARLDEKAVQAVPEAPKQVAAKTAKPFHLLPLSQQAAIRCNDPQFQAFMKVETMEDAAEAVRAACRVPSRSYLDSVESAAHEWHLLMQDFEQFQRGYR